MKIESMKAIDPFAILGIERGASMPEIRQAWLDQLQAWHPDRFDKESSIYATADEKTKLINAAFDMLKASGGAAPPPQPQPEPEPDDEVNWDDEPGPFRGGYDGTTGPIGPMIMEFVMEFGGEVLGFVFLLLKQVVGCVFFLLKQWLWPLVIAGLCVLAYLRLNTAISTSLESPCNIRSSFSPLLFAAPATYQMIPASHP
jgi:hypothetical protein